MNSAFTGRFGGERTSKNVDVELKQEEGASGGMDLEVFRKVKAEGNETVLMSMKRRNEKITGPACRQCCVCGQRHLRESEINERGN